MRKKNQMARVALECHSPRQRPLKGGGVEYGRGAREDLGGLCRGGGQVCGEQREGKGESEQCKKGRET